MSKKITVMPGNHSSGLFHYWQGKYGNLGHLHSPLYFSASGEVKYKGYTTYDYLPYALDNGKFICWNNGIDWNQKYFNYHLDRIKDTGHKPEWIVVPDEVTKGEKTIELYKKWSDKLREYNVPLALAVQDGITVENVLKLAQEKYFNLTSDVIFIGGTTEWKLKTLPGWTKHFKRVHLARVNTWKRLWQAHEYGCESIDGTGWFRGDPKQKESLEFFLQYQAGSKEIPKQYNLNLEGINK